MIVCQQNLAQSESQESEFPGGHYEWLVSLQRIKAMILVLE